MSDTMSDTILGSTAPEAIEIGRTSSGKRIRTNTGHTLLFGGTGSGKSSKILMNILLSTSGLSSIFVLDTAGELAAVTAPWRSTVGDIVILNPFHVLTNYQGYEFMRGVGVNCLAALDPDSDDFEENAALLAEALIVVESKEPHWDESARALLTAIIIYVVLIARQNGTVPTMARVRELLCSASAPPSKSNPEGKGIPKLARVMMRSGRPGLRNLASQFTEWNNEITGIASTAKRQTRSFDAPQIARNMARNDFDFADLKRKPTTCYVIVPPHMTERHGKFLRLILTAALQASMRPREAGEPTVLFILDEFPALGHMKIVETMWTQVRKYSVRLLASFQDMLQGQDIYKQRWGSFVANANALLFFRPNDPTTAEWLSKRLGETTRMLQTMNESKNQTGGSNSGRSFNPGGEGGSTGATKGWGFTRSTNTSPVKVPLTLPHELYGLREGEMRVFLAGVKDGLTVEAVPYFEIEKLDRRAQRNPYVHNVPRRRDLPPPPADPRHGDDTPDSIFDRMMEEMRRKSPAPPPPLPPMARRRWLPAPEDLSDFDENDRL